MKLKNETEKIICPVCGKNELEPYDICDECGWEFDPWQYDEEDMDGGANNLSLKDYKKWWAKLNGIMPDLIKKYGVGNSKVFAPRRYNNFVVPRENIVPFVNELSEYGVKIQANFYNVCERYGYSSYSFRGFVWAHGETPKENNDEILNLIFSENPVKACEEYNLIQLSEILNKSENAAETWEKLTPNIDVRPNPEPEDLEYMFR